eukprot:TRINITY_DN10292_c0_g1_i1.p1 TRINITY_DN10292_c0_g1~~TRINITY_DN10292_c0_g1_i1.p1  ORF type:complete len:309 (-),score=92.75 TRINITY_DN10292_c0_g1_i1:33-959(-)
MDWDEFAGITKNTNSLTTPPPKPSGSSSFVDDFFDQKPATETLAPLNPNPIISPAANPTDIDSLFGQSTSVKQISKSNSGGMLDDFLSLPSTPKLSSTEASPAILKLAPTPASTPSIVSSNSAGSILKTEPDVLSTLDSLAITTPIAPKSVEPEPQTIVPTSTSTSTAAYKPTNSPISSPATTPASAPTPAPTPAPRGKATGDTTTPIVTSSKSTGNQQVDELSTLLEQNNRIILQKFKEVCSEKEELARKVTELHAIIAKISEENNALKEEVNRYAALQQQQQQKEEAEKKNKYAALINGFTERLGL